MTQDAHTTTLHRGKQITRSRETPTNRQVKERISFLSVCRSACLCVSVFPFFLSLFPRSAAARAFRKPRDRAEEPSAALRVRQRLGVSRDEERFHRTCKQGLEYRWLQVEQSSSISWVELYIPREKICKMRLGFNCGGVTLLISDLRSSTFSFFYQVIFLFSGGHFNK